MPPNLPTSGLAGPCNRLVLPARFPCHAYRMRSDKRPRALRLTAAKSSECLPAQRNKRAAHTLSREYLIPTLEVQLPIAAASALRPADATCALSRCFVGLPPRTSEPPVCQCLHTRCPSYATPGCSACWRLGEASSNTAKNCCMTCEHDSSRSFGPNARRPPFRSI